MRYISAKGLESVATVYAESYNDLCEREFDAFACSGRIVERVS
jgi:hypothetical protein